MIYCFDVDNTICKTVNGNYPAAIPIKSRIKKINKLYKDHIILIWTSRGYQTGIDWRGFTKQQLDDWGVLYHEFHVGKPYFDVFVDDKAMSDKEYFK